MIIIVGLGMGYFFFSFQVSYEVIVRQEKSLSVLFRVFKFVEDLNFLCRGIFSKDFISVTIKNNEFLVKQRTFSLFFF